MHRVTIKTIEMREIRLRLVRPFRSSAGITESRRIVLVQVHDTTGVVGWGECCALETPHYSPETTDSAWLMIRDHLGPKLVGKTFSEPSEVFPLLDRDVRGNLMAKAALEMAIWELFSRIEDVPLSRLLGGTRSKVATGVAIGLEGTLAELVDLAERAIAEGYQRIKVKIEPGTDLDVLDALRKTLGEDVGIIADANGAYTLGDTDHLRSFDSLGLQMIEQPLGADDIRDHAILQAQISTPVCLDESITSLKNAQEAVDCRSAQVINIKPSRVGGFANAIAIHDLCARHDIAVWCGGMLESGVGRAHNVALASLPHFTLPGDLSPSARYWDQDIVTPEWTMDPEGYVKVPLEKPGMGVVVDEDRLESLNVRTETLS